MTTQPQALQDTFQGLMPVQESIWKYFSDIGEAQGMLALTKPLVADGTLVDSNKSFFGSSLVYLNPRQGAWSVQGTTKIGDETLTVFDSLGWLLDRQKAPDVWVDRNPDGTVGGATLKAKKIGDGVAQLYWGS